MLGSTLEILFPTRSMVLGCSLELFFSAILTVTLPLIFITSSPYVLCFEFLIGLPSVHFISPPSIPFFIAIFAPFSV